MSCHYELLRVRISCVSSEHGFGGKVPARGVPKLECKLLDEKRRSRRIAGRAAPEKGAMLRPAAKARRLERHGTSCRRMADGRKCGPKSAALFESGPGAAEIRPRPSVANLERLLALRCRGQSRKSLRL